ncbi:MAG: ATPase, T2SS/T4P/T4SS family [Cellvibrio sp.]|uniref:ATPase, T2SS/T4P/T4SS family n=1 Tax=Cellvibrio sp. TaxID=1965322 RepID=UPI0031AB78CB
MPRFSVATKSGTVLNSFDWGVEPLTIGKSENCVINLHGWRVDRLHAEINTTGDKVFIAPKSNGRVLINKIRIAEPTRLNENDLIEIGDYQISITRVISDISHAIQNPQLNQFSADMPDASIIKQAMDDDFSSSDESNETSEYKKRLSEECRSRVHKSLLSVMDLRRVNVGSMSDQELRSFTADAIKEILNNYTDLPDILDKGIVAKQVLAEAVGLGPLEDLLDDESVSEIMVNASNEIFFEKSGKLRKSDITFTDDKAVLSAIERIVSPLGRRIDESSPMVDGRLKDGSRVNAVIPPLALKGPSITIRKFMKNRLGSEDLVRFDSISEPMVHFLKTAIVRKQNLVISGGTGSGKTTLLNVLSNFIPSDERIVTVEDAAELRLYQPNLVSLEARPVNQEGKGEVTIRDLVKNCLRMRPDRIVVGECRSGEALDMLQAMNTGHDGSLTTIHANSPRDCISRVEVLVLMSGMDLPVRAIREQISSAVNIIVQQTRFACGSRKVTSIAEVTGIEGDVVQLAEIFKFKQTGYDFNGKVTGHFMSTGVVPEFYESLRARGIEVDMSIFDSGSF